MLLDEAQVFLIEVEFPSLGVLECRVDELVLDPGLVYVLNGQVVLEVVPQIVQLKDEPLWVFAQLWKQIKLSFR